MKIKSLISLLALLLILSPLVFSQSRETGAIVGTVSDEDGTPLPGVTTTLSGPKIMGDRTAITDANGQYRFPALPPGTYSIKAELPGFNTVVRENIRLHTTIRLTADITMKIATVEEEITVIAVSPTVDVKTSETASVTLSDEILRNMPTSQFVTNIVNLAPGVDQNVAYGSSQSTGVAYQIDGVDVSDPELGSAWVFLDYNVVEEAKIMGIGLNAEYGAFTGVIFNTITKSGGNEFSGHGEIIWQSTKRDFLGLKNFWTTDNNQAYIEDNPSLTTPIQGLWDSSVHLGGPLKRDKVWFFLGFQYYRSKSRPTGLEEPHFRDYKQPRSFVKITAQPSSKFNLTGFLEIDVYNGINRNTGVTHPVPDTGVKQTSPEAVGNFNLTYIINPKTFFDFKGSYFWGYYYLDPQGSGTAVFVSDADNYRWFNNSQWWYKADRKRGQANASISHYAEDFITGNHDFKFGTEFEYGWARSRYGLTGSIPGIGDGVYIYDWYGYRYAYQYTGYDFNTSYTRNELFAQDSWAITENLTLNLGGRFSMMRGYVKGKSGAVYSANRIAPRFGFAWDIFNDHSTVLKGHFGRFTEAMYTGVHDRLNPIEAFGAWSYWYEDSPGSNTWTKWYQQELSETLLAEDIGHPYMDQWTVGIERELFKDSSIGISYINRRWKSIINTYDILGDYEIVTLDDPITTDTYDVYNQLNAGERQLVLANIEPGVHPWIGDDAYRQYHGVEVLFNKRFSNRWQLLASYVWSRTTGTINNGFGDDVGWGGSTYDPNFWINRDGKCTRDPTHMFKLQGSYILPLDIHFNAHFRYITGNTYTRGVRTPRGFLDQGRTTILSEPSGSRRLEDQAILDLRLEKTFMFGNKLRLGLMMDIFNVFNDDSITSWGSTIDSSWFPDLSQYASSDGHLVYGLVAPRGIRLGIRAFF